MHDKWPQGRIAAPRMSSKQIGHSNSLIFSLALSVAVLTASMTLPSAVSLIFDRARWSFSDGGQEKKRRRKIREMGKMKKSSLDFSYVKEIRI
jgi:hypothetical protein